MIERQFATLGDGCRIAWRFDGPADAPVLLLSNSLGTDMGMWEPQMNAWTRHARVLRYDQRGHGASDAPPGAYSLDRLGRDVIELLDSLKLETVDFCGLSLGGMTGQWLGIRARDRVRRLVLANTSSHMGPASQWDARIDAVRKAGLAPIVHASVERWFTPAFAARAGEAIEPVRAMLLHTDPQGYAGCCAAIRDMDLRPITELMRAPALVIAGKQDPATPVAESEYLVRQMSEAQLAVLDAAHLSNVEQPQDFGEAVTAFLRASPSGV